VVVTDERVPVRQGGQLRGYRAEVVGVREYYSYGGRVGERSYEVGRAYRWGFNGQEVVGELGRSHYTARYWEYDGRLGRRWNVDPVVKAAESRYAVFGGNPVRFMDPDGRDTVEILQGSGVLHRHIRARGRDVFYIVQKEEDGLLRRVGSIDFEEGTLRQIWSRQAYIDEYKEHSTMTFYEVEGDESAKRLFEFLADPAHTRVEWTHAKVGREGSGRNIVATTHKEDYTGAGRYLLDKGYTLRVVVHSHTEGYRAGPSRKDIENAKDYYKRFPDIELYVYKHPGKYIEYGPTGAYSPAVIIEEQKSKDTVSGGK